MEKQDNIIKSKYLAHISGPILFTAPHSKKLYRGGLESGQEKRVHLKQIHTSFLAVYFALEVAKFAKAGFQCGSFCVWGKTSVLSEEDMDPNYLTEKMYKMSPFHQVLHEFQSGNRDTPLFHVDIHGKFDRKQNCELDIGIESMVCLWQNDQLAKRIKAYSKNRFDKVFANMKLGQFHPKANVEPYLSGFWGSQVATMTTQAIQLGIPSVQLQIPRKMRNLMVKNLQFRSQFAQALAGIYNQVVVPYWPKRTIPLLMNPDCLKKANLLILNKNQLQSLREDLLKAQNSASLNLNVKMI